MPFPHRPALLLPYGLSLALAVGTLPNARAQSPSTAAVFGHELCDSGPCSPFDDDGDGIPDVFDVCPHKAETFNGFEDGDGCPDPGTAELDDLSQRIFFDSGSARISPSSRPALAALAALIKSPQSESLGIVDIIGHADHRGSDPVNQRLSGRRASAVRDWLVHHGVSSSRLRATAAGALPGTTPELMRLNRRVEIRAQAQQLHGISHVEEVPQVQFPSHWRVKLSEQGTSLQILSVSDTVYSLYGVARRRNLWGLYARSATGHEIDMLLNVLTSGAIRASCRLRAPASSSGWATGPILQQWNESTESAVPTPASPYAVPRMLAPRQKSPSVLAVYGGTLYFGTSGAIMQMPKSGGTPTPVILGVTPTALAIDGSDVYWAEADKIRRAYKDGGNALTIASKQNAPQSMAIYGNHIYWATASKGAGEPATIRSAMRNGSEAKVLASVDDARAIRVNATGLYYANTKSGGIFRLPPQVETPIALVSGLDTPIDISIDETHLYWADKKGVSRIPLAGGAPLRLSDTSARRLVLSPSHVYFIAGGSGDTGGDSLMRVPKQGGHVGVTISEGAMELAVDEANVYWTRITGAAEGAVLSIPR